MKKGIVIAVGTGKPAEKEKCCEMCGQPMPESQEEGMESEEEEGSSSLDRLAEMIAIKQLKK